MVAYADENLGERTRCLHQEERVFPRPIDLLWNGKRHAMYSFCSAEY